MTSLLGINMGNCLGDMTIKDEDVQARYDPKVQASHKAVNPVGAVIQMGED